MKKKQFETILYSAVGVGAMFVLLTGFNVVSAALKQRLDLTRERAYTLSEGTKAILKKIDTPVKIRYCWRSFPQSSLTKPLYHGERFELEVFDGVLRRLRDDPTAFVESFPAGARLRLPMQPGNRSLNLSNAVAVAVYEVWRD